MAPTVREDPKYQRIQQGAAEVDDYVLQEFLTDIIDSAPFNAAGNQTIQLLDQTKPQVFGNGNGNGNGREPGKGVSGLRQWSLGSVDFTALLNTPPVPADMMDLGPPVQIDPAGGVTINGGAKKTTKKKSGSSGGGSMNGGSSEAPPLDGLDDDPGDPEARRKRQRHANLQAQRRCRERHRNHVTELEKENKDLRDQMAKQEDEIKRLKQALAKTAAGLEQCQLKSSGATDEKTKLIKEKSELERQLRVCSIKNSKLETALNSLPGSPARSEGGLDRNNSLDIDQEMRLKIEDEFNNGRTVKVEHRAGRLSRVSTCDSDGGEEFELPTLQEEACAVAQAAQLELKHGAEDNSEDTQEAMRLIALKLTEHFKSFLVDGNACSQMGVYSILSGPPTDGEPSPCAGMLAQGPGQPESVFKRAHFLAREMELTETQRRCMVRRWKSHAQALGKIFELRKKLTADALMLQGSSPVATLVDFMSIGAGTLAGAITEQDVLDRTGQLTLTGFAAHACRVESVIRDLRANISAEQLQNFELVSKVVDEVLTPLQTCVICAKWGSGCPDMLAVTRAITVQTMELMPELR